MMRRVAAAAIALATLGAAAPVTAGNGHGRGHGPPASVGNGHDDPRPAAASSHGACPDWAMYGRTLSRTFSTDCPSPITPSTVATLVPKWVFKTDKTVTASPVVVDGSVYVGDWTNAFYALDAETGAVRWETNLGDAPGAAFGPIVSSAAVADVAMGNSSNSVKRLVIVGSGAHLIALNADDGTIRWTYHAEAHDAAGDPSPPDTPIEIESSPLVWNDTVYVGVDPHSHPESETGGVGGGLVALSAKNGALKWKYEPDPAGLGCGGMWSSPLLDPGRDLVYMATANCPTAWDADADGDEDPWAPGIEAVTALDATPESGAAEPVWHFQPAPNNRDDVDFGATPNLFVDPQGVPVLGAGKKDGAYYALDPDTGQERWRTQVAEPGNVDQDFAIGGFIGSPAIWNGNVFGGTAIGGPPYYHSLHGHTGEIRWQSAAAPSYAASATVNGVVFAGALDDLLKAFDARNGRILWTAPLLGPISSGPAIVGDSLYVGSGTSSSDACAKELPINEQCQQFFDEAVGATGGVHAFELALAGDAAGVDARLLNGQGNQLDAYDLSQDPPQYDVFIPNAGNGGKDINAQICQFPAPHDRYILVGEDTDQDQGVPQGWGVFDLETKRQVGKLIADYGDIQPPKVPDQYGCAFETDGAGSITRIFVSQVGTGSFTADDAQFIVFYASSPALDAVFGRRTAEQVCPGGDCSALTKQNSDWCILDDGIHTAGGLAMDGAGNVYMAQTAPSAPPQTPAPGRVLRYRGPFPPDDEHCFRVAPETFIQDFQTATPGAIVPALDENGVPTGNWYVSSVIFPPVVNEYDESGAFVRNVLPPGFGTPFGLAVDSAGTLYAADLGITLNPEQLLTAPDTLGLGPADGEGSVLRIRFRNGLPLPPDVLKDELNFPDGLGIVVPPTGA